MAEQFTMLPKNTGVRGTPMLGFDMAGGGWVNGQPLLPRDGRGEVPLGTALIAVIPELQYGFKHKRQFVMAPTRDCALATPLRHNPRWRRTMFLPLADPATGAVTFTFFAYLPQRMALIEQLIAATRQRERLGVRALPIVELARETYRFSDTRPFFTPELAARAAALIPPDVPDPSDGVPDDMDLYDPALPIVAWIDLSNPSAAGPHRRSHTDQLTPAMLKILARLPDPHGAVRLTYKYLFDPTRTSGPIHLNFIAAQMDRVEKWVELRRDVPALKALSDEEINVACNVAFAIKEMDDDEYFHFAEIFRMSGENVK